MDVAVLEKYIVIAAAVVGVCVGGGRKDLGWRGGEMMFLNVFFIEKSLLSV